MIHVGIDHHKRYSHVNLLDDSGTILWEGRLGNDRSDFEKLKSRFIGDTPVRSVLEAGRNWGPLFDTLDELGMNPILANPLKVRAIAEAKIKTDAIDAQTLAMLLKGDLIPRVYVPTRAVRDQKNLLRHRMYLVKIKTAIKNRVHNLLDRNRQKPPAVSDIFGAWGRAWMKKVALPELDAKLMSADLAMLDSIQAQIKESELWIQETLTADPHLELIRTLPGVGKVLGPVIALEINSIDRFLSAGKLCAYAGLVPSTYSSGGKTHHGGVLAGCNRHLRCAFVEAAWIAIRVSPYFGAFFKRLKARRGTNKSLVAVARKLCEACFHCLRTRTPYREREYRFRGTL